MFTEVVLDLFLSTLHTSLIPLVTHLYEHDRPTVNFTCKMQVRFLHLFLAIKAGSLKNSLTTIMNEESLTQDETGIIWIALKLNADLRAPGHHLETLSGAQVLSDHMGGEIPSVENGQHIGVADIQTLRGRDKNKTKKSGFS